MSNGTYINDVYAIRIHKSNAEDTRDECEDMIQYFRDQFMLLGASTPRDSEDCDWNDHVRIEIDGAMEELRDNHINSYLASLIINNPEDAKDEFVDSDWTEEDKCQSD